MNSMSSLLEMFNMTVLSNKLTICLEAAHRLRLTNGKDSAWWWISDDDDEIWDGSGKSFEFKDSSGLWGLQNGSSIHEIDIEYNWEKILPSIGWRVGSIDLNENDWY
jgi:hypothetical protein